MTVGSVSVFQFAYNLHSVPLAIIGVSYSVAAFPLLAELFAKGDLSTFRLHINSALRHIIFWSVPAIALIVVLRAQIVRVILGSGAFNWDDTRLTAAVLAILALSLVAQAVNLLFIRALYAGGHTRAPLVIASCGLVVSVLLAYLFYYSFLSYEVVRSVFEFVFRVKDVPGTEVLMIAVAYAVSVIGQSIFLASTLVRYYHITFNWVKERLIKSVTASIIGGVTAYVTLNFVVFGIDMETFVGIVLQGGIAGLFGIVSIIWAYYVLKMPEFFEVKETLHRRVFKVSVPVATDEPL
jgi:putative peptidoglycan lipid II flippase